MFDTKKGRLIFKCIAGSHLYGTNTSDSDTDVRGVFIPHFRYVYGMERIEQVQDKANDIVFYELRKFMGLAIACNPNIVELLFVPENEWVVKSLWWDMIVGNRTLFLSKKARWTFSGYAFSQLHRIKRHRQWLLNPPTSQPLRSQFGLPEGEKLINDSQMGAFNKLLATYLETISELHPLKEQLEEMQETRDYLGIVQTMEDDSVKMAKSILPIDENYMLVVQKEKQYAQALREWNQYRNWKKNRNKERAVLEEKYGYDTKHASHLYRLCTEGQELLMNGIITFPRPDAEQILEIRNGKLSYDELLELVGDIDAKFNVLYENSVLPHKPNYHGVNELCMEVMECVLIINKKGG